ncbi:acetate kinase : Acetate kinase OS=Singulisphaera acidiphila (strain ATCC BAA-1392 / DSM 18658 / VKM B-2454 / MOB10) GN=ackA PE=3 SV=1: Acetate_kinase [Gemmata massiliana]|uniref:Acetate kinase n=1 Tax=Gemmata massiliana TaxID=1210884 RepID=A0A6P2D872_9BACT|nr:acetate/propionate family kinase [Gemmata massiliana]VTR97369.1 acetate kinase : Acetate kinase OS=Singulisphaera acidiphila (strain ATCC BAA-1392 / DSM 18658 / VKM B-2454 / MOB10) GN=ackA PE=3 SV=1: Acetate_kinase [Gemmata massiliana]
MAAHILTINAGSSSTKFATFTAGGAPQEISHGKLERLDSAGAVLDELEARGATTQLAGIGHRLVHGGSDRVASELVTPELLRDLKQLEPLDPTHLPAELELIAACTERFPGVPQVACFDTAFHRGLPTVARTLPIPRRYQTQGIRRYGFHGISYEFLMEELARTAGAEVARGRIVLAHLGSGASMAAVHNGSCVDTTMGFTPTGGLVMGTRTGDLDPGVLVHLARTEKLSADQIDKLVNRESGLRGISETSSDIRELLAHESTDPRAAEALAVFCYQARKWIGAMAAALGGLDTLVFSGGIGENAPEIRTRICANLAFLGVTLDPVRNAASAPVISPDGSSTTVRVIRTNEEAMIARTVSRLLAR